MGLLLLQAQQVLRLPLPLPSLHIPHQLSHPTTILPHLRYLATLNRLNSLIFREVKLQHLLYILDPRSALLFSSPELPQPFSTTPGIQWTVLKQWSVHECWQQWIRTISECSSTSTRPCGWWTPTCWTLAIPSSTLRWSSKCSWWISSKIWWCFELFDQSSLDLRQRVHLQQEATSSSNKVQLEELLLLHQDTKYSLTDKVALLISTNPLFARRFVCTMQYIIYHLANTVYLLSGPGKPVEQTSPGWEPTARLLPSLNSTRKWN